MLLCVAMGLLLVAGGISRVCSFNHILLIYVGILFISTSCVSVCVVSRGGACKSKQKHKI